MPIITLTTDWNKDDYYLAAIKGQLNGLCPGVNIVDISHQVPSFNVRHAAFLIKNSYSHFPDGTIHIIGVNSTSVSKPRFLMISVDKQYFLSYDTGIFGLLFKDEPKEVIEIKTEDTNQVTFPELTVFARIACEIVQGKKMSELGKTTSKFTKTIPLRAAIDELTITGSVIFIDSYRNAITNITRELFDRIGLGRKFEISIQSDHYKVKKINSNYGETTMGELLAIFNSIDLLEIAINRGNAADLLGLSTNSVVRVKFME
ncbi:MAG: SAM-dependent chlorinase/fluorinase [Bacteroidales bacterium]|nr:SAM-dependent chlorinase/fluorinase [Bacteroidales bacterium]